MYCETLVYGDFYMATLINRLTNKSATLRSSHIFGRSSGSSNTLLTNEGASRLHVSILWDGCFWQLQDMSTNGTFINGKRIPSGIKHVLKKHEKINFGSLSSDVWEVVNDGEPKCMLVSLDTSVSPIELEKMMVLPDEDAPEVTLLMSIENRWLCETLSGTTELAAGDKINTSQGDWYFVDHYPIEETQFIAAYNTGVTLKVLVCFEVSQNEEHVGLTFHFANQEINLAFKAYNYVILLLARKRLEDINNNIGEKEQGWLYKDQLCMALGKDEQYLNIQIFRFRKKTAKLTPNSIVFPQPIERRYGEMRFAFGDIEINGGNMVVMT